MKHHYQPNARASHFHRDQSARPLRNPASQNRTNHPSVLPPVVELPEQEVATTQPTPNISSNQIKIASNQTKNQSKPSHVRQHVHRSSINKHVRVHTVNNDTDNEPSKISRRSSCVLNVVYHLESLSRSTQSCLTSIYNSPRRMVEAAVVILVFFVLFLTLQSMSKVDISNVGTGRHARWYLARSPTIRFEKLAAQLMHLQEKSVVDQDVASEVSRKHVAIGHVNNCNANVTCSFMQYRDSQFYVTSLFAELVNQPTIIQPCLGHQFIQWLKGPYHASVAKASYAYTPMPNSSFSSFLGLGINEQSFVSLTTGLSSDIALSLIPQSSDLVRDLQRQHVVREADMRSQGRVARTIIQLTDQSVMPVQPVDRNDIELDGMFVPSVPELHTLVCNHEMNQLLRQKYCLARVREASSQLDNQFVDVLTRDRQVGLVPVAFALECGAGCFTDSRFLSIDSILTTLEHLEHAFRKGHFGKPAVHFFIESAETHNHLNHMNHSEAEHQAISDPAMNRKLIDDIFHSIKSSKIASRIAVELHIDISTNSLFHALVTADVFVASNSPFSSMASTFRSTPTIAHDIACGFSVAGYNSHTGIFNRQELINMMKESRKWTVTHFDNEEKCFAMRRWNDLID